MRMQQTWARQRQLSRHSAPDKQSNFPSPAFDPICGIALDRLLEKKIAQPEPVAQVFHRTNPSHESNLQFSNSPIQTQNCVLQV